MMKCVVFGCWNMTGNRSGVCGQHRIAKGIEAGTDETLKAAQPEGREPGAEGIRP